VIELGERFWVELVPASLRILAYAHQGCLAQHTQVFRDAGLADTQGINQLADEAGL
jgi:hypothetical protein